MVCIVDEMKGEVRSEDMKVCYESKKIHRHLNVTYWGKGGDPPPVQYVIYVVLILLVVVLSAGSITGRYNRDSYHVTVAIIVQLRAYLSVSVRMYGVLVLPTSSSRSTSI